MPSTPDRSTSRPWLPRSPVASRCCKRRWGGRRWLEEAEIPEWALALGVTEAEVVEAVARQHRRLAAAGFFTEVDSQREREEGLLLGRHLPLLLDARDEILATPELATCFPVSAQVSTVLRGTRSVALGLLLRTWAAGQWRARCPGCEGKAHVVRMGMNVLTGSVGASGVCVDCRCFGRVDVDDVRGLVQSSGQVFAVASDWLASKHEAWVSGRGPLWPDAGLPLRDVLARLGIDGIAPLHGEVLTHSPGR